MFPLDGLSATRVWNSKDTRSTYRAIYIHTRLKIRFGFASENIICFPYILPARRHNTFNYVSGVRNLTWPNLTKPAVVGTVTVFVPGVRTMAGRRRTGGASSLDSVTRPFVTELIAVCIARRDGRFRVKNKTYRKSPVEPGGAGPRWQCRNHRTNATFSRFAAAWRFSVICDWTAGSGHLRFRRPPESRRVWRQPGHVAPSIMGESETIRSASPLTNADRSIVSCRSHPPYTI